MCNIDYVDISCEFYSERQPKARKDHVCGDCFRTIKAGENYLYISGSWEGDFSTHKQCLNCQKVANLLTKHCGGYLFGEMDEDLIEHVYPSIPWAMKAARGLIGIRRKWQRFDGKGLMQPQQSEVQHDSAR